MRRLLVSMLVLLVASIDVPARACMNEMAEARFGIGSFLAVAFVGVVVHALLLPILKTPKERVAGLLVIEVGVLLAGANTSSPPEVFYAVIGCYAALTGLHAFGRVGPRQRVPVAVPSPASAPENAPTVATGAEPTAIEPDRDRAA